MGLSRVDATRRMIGLARVVTDFVTFGYVADVYVLEELELSTSMERQEM